MELYLRQAVIEQKNSFQSRLSITGYKREQM